MNNTIARIAVMPVQSDNGLTHAISVALNIHDAATAQAFVGEVMQQVLLQRMASPPDTSVLFISMVGDLASDQFADQWKACVQREQAMQVFMGMMQTAVVIHGTPTGQMLGEASLL